MRIRSRRSGCDTEPFFASSLTLVIVLLVSLAVFAPTPARAGEWVRWWGDDFESQRDNGWIFETYTREDRLLVVTDPTSKCRNQALLGESLNPSRGSGFNATSPTFEENDRSARPIPIFRCPPSRAFSKTTFRPGKSNSSAAGQRPED